MECDIFNLESKVLAVCDRVSSRISHPTTEDATDYVAMLLQV